MRSSFFSFQFMPPVVKNLLIINIIVWAFMALIPAADQVLTKYLALYFFTSPGFNFYQLFTYMFLHGGLLHLFFNMFALVVFGTVIERVMGSSRFLFYYIACGIFAALFQESVFAMMINKYSAIFDSYTYNQIIEEGWNLMRQGYTFTNPDMAALNSFVNTPMVGASGAIYGVILAFGMLFPNQPMYIWFIPIPIKAKWLVIGYAVIELMSGVGSSADGVAHFAHLGGMIIGLIMMLYWKKKGVFNNQWFF
jgi:membrane associated rhomboid family serine protease